MLPYVEAKKSAILLLKSLKFLGVKMTVLDFEKGQNKLC
jgi:hypothetical protein